MGEAKSRPVPVRLNKENDAYLMRLQQARELHNRNLAFNIILEEHRMFHEVYREQAKNKALKLMRDFHLKPKDLE